MATFQGTRRDEALTASQEADNSLLSAILDATVIALIAASFVTLALNTIARL